MSEAGAKQAAEKGQDSSKTLELTLAGAEARVDSKAVVARLKSCPVTKHAQVSATVSFSAASKAQR
jgi:hypothetical protein